MEEGVEVEEPLPERQWTWIDVPVVLCNFAQNVADAFSTAFEQFAEVAAMHANHEFAKRDKRELEETTLAEIGRLPVVEADE